MTSTPRPPGPLLALGVTIVSGLAVFFCWVALSRRLPLGLTLAAAMLLGRAAVAVLAPRPAGIGWREGLGFTGLRASRIPGVVLCAGAVFPLLALQARLLDAAAADPAANPFVVPLPADALATRAGLVAALVAFGLVEPVATEALFRGWAQPVLVARWGRVAGIAAGAALFALAYAALAGFGRAALPAGLTGLMLGVLLGWLRDREGTTVAPLVAHGIMGLCFVLAAPAAGSAAGVALGSACAIAGAILVARPEIRSAPEATRGSRDRAPRT